MTSISAAAQIRCVSAVRGSRTALGRPRSASLASRKSRAAARIRRDTTTRAAIEDGQMVTVHYVMTFPDGEVGDDTRKRDSPITLPIGQGQLFPKLEEGIKSMEVGEKKTFELACADAYGERKEEAVQKLPATPEELEQLKEQVQPGQMVQLPNGATALCVSLDEDGNCARPEPPARRAGPHVCHRAAGGVQRTGALRGADRSFRREQGHREQVRSRARGGACVWWGGL